MTLTQIADNILTTWGKINFRDNEYPMWQETIKDKIKMNCAVFIRRDIERNGISEQFYQTLPLELQKVDKADFCRITVDCTVLRTKNKLPQYLRLKSDSSFKFVGDIDKSITFNFVDLEYLDLAEASLVLTGVPKYYIQNNYIYVLGNTLFKWMMIEPIILDTTPAGINNCLSNCDPEFEEYPVSLDILKVVVDEIVNELRSNIERQET